MDEHAQPLKDAVAVGVDGACVNLLFKSARPIEREPTMSSEAPRTSQCLALSASTAACAAYSACVCRYEWIMNSPERALRCNGHVRLSVCIRSRAASAAAPQYKPFVG
eukprot:6180061-Pleurochrysis_carterae.AAC.2